MLGRSPFFVSRFRPRLLFYVSRGNVALKEKSNLHKKKKRERERERKKESKKRNIKQNKKQYIGNY